MRIILKLEMKMLPKRLTIEQKPIVPFLVALIC